MVGRPTSQWNSRIWSLHPKSKAHPWPKPNRRTCRCFGWRLFFSTKSKVTDFYGWFFFSIFFWTTCCWNWLFKARSNWYLNRCIYDCIFSSGGKASPPPKIWWTFRLCRKWQRSELYWYHIFWVNFSSKGLWVGGSYKVIDLSSGNLRGKT